MVGCGCGFEEDGNYSEQLTWVGHQELNKSGRHGLLGAQGEPSRSAGAAWLCRATGGGR